MGVLVEVGDALVGLAAKVAAAGAENRALRRKRHEFSFIFVLRKEEQYSLLFSNDSFPGLGVVDVLELNEEERRVRTSALLLSPISLPFRTI